MTNQVIPAEAVEAAARANYEARTGKEWRLLDNFQRPIEMSIMRRTLKAAAPHMLAGAVDDVDTKTALRDAIGQVYSFSPASIDRIAAAIEAEFIVTQRPTQ